MRIQIRNIQFHSIAQQRGATLAVVLIFLVLVTLIGVTAMSTTTLEEKMAGNQKEQNAAFQAAEAALRDAILDILGFDSAGVASVTRSGPPGPGRNPPISGETDFGDSLRTRPSCSNTPGPTLGLCLAPTDVPADSAFGNARVLAENFTAVPSVPYGTYTNALPLANVARQPRYLIEAVRIRLSGEEKPGTAPPVWYRITARGYGERIETQVTLQEVFRSR